MVLVTYATWSLSQLELQTSNATLTGLLVILGIGMGLGIMPVMTAGLNAIPARLTGQGSSLLNMLRQVGSSFSIAILSSVMQTGQDLHYARIAEHMTNSSPIATFLNQLTMHFQCQGLANQSAQAMAIFLVIYPKTFYISANIEEDRVTRVRPGQPVDITIESIPGIKFSGRVNYIGQAALSTFSLLPVSTTGGNFTKVVQRVPIKIDGRRFSGVPTCL